MILPLFIHTEGLDFNSSLHTQANKLLDMKLQPESSLTDAIEQETFKGTFMNFTNLQSPVKVFSTIF